MPLSQSQKKPQCDESDRMQALRRRVKLIQSEDHVWANARLVAAAVAVRAARLSDNVPAWLDACRELDLATNHYVRCIEALR